MAHMSAEPRTRVQPTLRDSAEFDSLSLSHAVLLWFALGCVLLIALLIATRVPRVATLLAGLLFAVHPANVEAVAWISQLETDAALAFALGAVLSQRRHPALAHRVHSEHREAIDCFERALRLGGPLQSVIPSELESRRAQWRQAQKTSTS